MVLQYIHNDLMDRTLYFYTYFLHMYFIFEWKFNILKLIKSVIVYIHTCVFNIIYIFIYLLSSIFFYYFFYFPTFCLQYRL